MEVCFLDTLAMVALRIGQTEESFLQEITVISLAYSELNYPTVTLTLVRSKRQMKCSGNHGYLRHRQCHLLPI